MQLIQVVAVACIPGGADEYLQASLSLRQAQADNMLAMLYGTSKQTTMRTEQNTLHVKLFSKEGSFLHNLRERGCLCNIDDAQSILL